MQLVHSITTILYVFFLLSSLLMPFFFLLLLLYPLIQIFQCFGSSKSSKRTFSKSLSSAPLVNSEVEGSSSYKRFEDSVSDESSVSSSLSKSPSPAHEESEELDYHTIVIDCSPIIFADSMGVTVLEQVSAHYENLMMKIEWFSS